MDLVNKILVQPLQNQLTTGETVAVPPGDPPPPITAYITDDRLEIPEKDPRPAVFRSHLRLLREMDILLKPRSKQMSEVETLREHHDLQSLLMFLSGGLNPVALLMKAHYILKRRLVEFSRMWTRSNLLRLQN
jgi:hypothetical protein